MAFTSKSQHMNQFQKRSGSNEFKPTQADTLFEVVSYDLDTATILGRRCNDGKECRISVSFDAVARGRKSEKTAQSASWFGQLIDGRMAAVIEVGSKFVAERAVWVRNQKGGYPLYECSKIINLTDQSEGKIVQGLLTVSGWEGRIRSAQSWAKESFTLLDSDKISALVLALDDVAKRKASGEYPVEVGFQFRIVRDDQVVEVSQCYDFVAAVKDESGTEVSPRRTPTGEEFCSLMTEFSEYAVTKYSGTSAVVEVCTYHNYNTSKMSKSMDAPEKSSGHRMISSQSKLDPESDVIQQGKNLAVNGILSLTSDAVDKKSRTFIGRDMVNKIFINGVQGNVHSFIRSPGGVKVRFADNLKVIQERKESAAPVQQGAVDPFGPDSGLQNVEQGTDLNAIFDEELNWEEL